MPDPNYGAPIGRPAYVRPSDRSNPLVTAGSLLIAIVVLYLGSGILVPLVLAILLAFALAPLIRRLRRLHVPHILAILLAVGFAAAIIGTIGYLVATQLVKLASNLPTYQQTVTAKTQSLQQSFGDGQFIDSLLGAIDQLTGEFPPPEDGSAVQPMPVTIANGGAGPLDLIQGVMGSVLGPLATGAIVFVFLIFLLLEREDLRDRFLKLVSRGDLRTSTKVMNEAANRVGRYLLVQFGVNSCYGIVFGTGLTLIGVPNAVLWGLLAALFRYIPFVGTLMAASIPFMLAFAVDPGWFMLLASIGLFVGLELTVTNAIEPRLYGSSTGLSPLAVLVAAMFWATLWGPIGLILSTPITVCLVVLGRYVPQLAFFETMLGSEPVLSQPERLYQRLVSGNVEEAVELAEEYIAGNDVQRFYLDVAVPALVLAEIDLSRDVSDLAHRRNVMDSMHAVMDDLDIETSEPTDAGGPPRVLCIGGRTELDDAAAQILMRLIPAESGPVKALAPLVVRQESVGQLDLDGVEVVCLCYLDDNPRSHARVVTRRLLRRRPGIKIIAIAMGAGPASNDRQRDWGVAQIVPGLPEAVAAVNSLVKVDKPSAEEPTKAIDDAALDRLRRLAHSEGPLALALGDIASAMNVPTAILDIVDTQFSELTAREEDEEINMASQSVVASGEALVVSDVAESTEFANDRFFLENGVRFYAGVPLEGPDGTKIGALALLDHQAREFSDAEREKLKIEALRLAVRLQKLAGVEGV
ncbi:AI-2E family transporter [Devosia submarina]|uniref:AI-2E family transporter n=1 Tax=Devosia submarina TaxID=1173082 RepID=UPI0013007823|nr:AI-2E family transporter [Devosia submarina]